MASSSETVRRKRLSDVDSVNVASNRCCISGRASSFHKPAAITPQDQPAHPRSSTFGQVQRLPARTRERTMAAVMDVCTTRVRVGAVVIGVGLLLMLPALARADTAPVITQAPAILGSPQVGAVLTASALWTGDPEPVATWAWQRCAKTTGSCTAIAGSAKDRYVVSAEDLGAYLRVRVKVTNSAGSVTAQSKPTPLILGAPEPTPTPTPSPT